MAAFLMATVAAMYAYSTTRTVWARVVVSLPGNTISNYLILLNEYSY
ncbi:hypothetical protein ASZ90_019148 [hydrocarbon metagenome]|uniref:Uncharacterized protein n=1 Tax=hydrocarbon metagenome TaxID=938273 RepID=A0A0W8E4X7_9ZZZZ